MNVILLIFMLFRPSHNAFACKPVPLPNCKGEVAIPVKAPSLESLRAKVEQFQTQLNSSIPADSAKHSCFNDHFASFHLHRLAATQTCRKQLSVIDRSVSRLINPDSEEWKSIRLEEAKRNLQKMANEVKLALTKFQNDHP